jgi:hypothetical protein
MAKRDWDKLRVQKRINDHGSASVSSEEFLGLLCHRRSSKTNDLLKNVTGEIELPWTRPLLIPKSKVKGKKHLHRAPVDRSSQVVKNLELKTTLTTSSKPI